MRERCHLQPQGMHERCWESQSQLTSGTVGHRGTHPPLPICAQQAASVPTQGSQQPLGPGQVDSHSTVFLEVVVVIQLLSHVRFFVTPWTTAHQASLSYTISQSLLKLMSIEPMMPSNHLILCHPLLLLPLIFPSIRIFSNESAFCLRWPKYWSISIGASNEYSGLISFRIDWFDLLAVQGTLKSLLQHHSSKTSLRGRKQIKRQVQKEVSALKELLGIHNLE